MHWALLLGFRLVFVFFVDGFRAADPPPAPTRRRRRKGESIANFLLDLLPFLNDEITQPNWPHFLSLRFPCENDFAGLF